ncbi:hypothetical protein [Pinisolibacter sp.]|uniref:hypothetical protein n=1 Tax=Pinisolibacter sp. TaxID=2172024 RepID=UPI002FDE40BB
MDERPIDRLETAASALGAVCDLLCAAGRNNLNEVSADRLGTLLDLLRHEIEASTAALFAEGRSSAA